MGMTSRIQQGCPMSGSIFAFGVHPFLRCALWRPPGDLIRLTAYADDSAIAFRARLARPRADHGRVCIVGRAEWPPTESEQVHVCATLLFQRCRGASSPSGVVPVAVSVRGRKQRAVPRSRGVGLDGGRAWGRRCCGVRPRSCMLARSPARAWCSTDCAPPAWLCSARAGRADPPRESAGASALVQCLPAVLGIYPGFVFAWLLVGGVVLRARGGCRAG